VLGQGRAGSRATRAIRSSPCPKPSRPKPPAAGRSWLLDDLHPADTSSWEAFDYLAHNLRDARVIVVGCGRPGELGGLSVAKQVVFGLEQEGILWRLWLDLLGPDELANRAG
jgi:hypothetical protein